MFAVSQICCCQWEDVFFTSCGFNNSEAALCCEVGSMRFLLRFVNIGFEINFTELGLFSFHTSNLWVTFCPRCPTNIFKVPSKYSRYNHLSLCSSKQARCETKLLFYYLYLATGHNVSFCKVFHCWCAAGLYGINCAVPQNMLENTASMHLSDKKRTQKIIEARSAVVFQCFKTTGA